MAITVDKTTNVIKITGTTDASQVVDANDQIEIQAIKWIGMDINSGDIVELQNTNGDTVWKHIAIANDTGTYDHFPKGHIAQGLKSDNIDSGELYIYIR